MLLVLAEPGSLIVEMPDRVSYQWFVTLGVVRKRLIRADALLVSYTCSSVPEKLGKCEGGAKPDQG
jgi:hypothetical protein